MGFGVKNGIEGRYVKLKDRCTGFFEVLDFRGLGAVSMALSPQERICLTNSSPKPEEVPVMNQIRGLDGMAERFDWAVREGKECVLETRSGIVSRNTRGLGCIDLSER